MSNSSRTGLRHAALRVARRCVRFRLRTLLIVAPLLAVGLGLAIRWQYPRYLESLAVAEVERLGGKIGRDGAGHVVSVDLPGRKIDDRALRELAPHLRNLPHLRDLVLVSNQVTDEGIQALAGVPQLQLVYLADTKVTSAGVAKLQQRSPTLKIDLGSPNPTAFRIAMRKIYDYAIVSLAAVPGGRRIVSGSGDGRLRVWDPVRQEMTMAVPAHEEWVFSVVFHPSGRMLATAGGDNLIKLWSWPGLHEIGRLAGHDNDVHGLCFTPDGQTLVSTSDDWTVRTWDVASRRGLHVLSGHTGTIPGLAISPDGRLAASASRDGTVRLWDIASGSAAGVLSGHSGDVMSVDFHPAGDELASASYDGTVAVWDLKGETKRQTFRDHDDWVFAVRYSPDGTQLASAAGDGVRLWERASGKLLWHAAEPKNASGALWLSADRLAAPSADGSIGLFAASTATPLAQLWTRFSPDVTERGMSRPPTPVGAGDRKNAHSRIDAASRDTGKERRAISLSAVRL